MYKLSVLLFAFLFETVFSLTPCKVVRARTIECGSTVLKDYEENVMTTYGRYPLTVSYGKGSKLYDESGKEYLDFTAGIATCCLGHSHPKLKAAVAAQMEKVHHCSNLYFIPEQGKLAKWLVANSCADKAFFCNSGAEANEAAIKLARKYAHTKRNIDYPVIITALNSFHGRTLTAITATGQPKYQKDFGPLTPGFEYTEYNNLPALKSLVEKINSQGNGMGVAAIMMEPLQGEGGIVPATQEFFQGVRDLCDQTGALMVVDEVQTGMGRTGLMWGHENLGVQPDVFTTAKAIGGGVPLGAMLCKEHCNVFKPGDHASTFGGNPLACAAGIAVTEVLEEENILANVLARGEQLRSLARSLQAKSPNLISDVRGWGLIIGVELVDGCGVSAADMAKALLETGVLVVPAGPRVVRFVPPLIITEAEIEAAMEKFTIALERLSKSVAPASV